MRKVLVPFFVISVMLAAFSFAETIAPDTNLAQGKSAYGTFSNAPLVTDGKLKAFATSGDITEVPQYLTVDLGKNMYLDRVKIYWDKNAYSSNYTVRTSVDSKYWQEELGGLDASTGVLDPASGTMSQSISLKKAMLNSKYVQVLIPAGTKIFNPSGNTVRISEVEIYPATNLKFSLDTAEVYAVSDSAAYIKYVTGLGAKSGSASFGTDPNKMSGVAGNTQTGVDNCVVISGLKPRTTYFYQIKTADFNGTSLSSKVLNFTTAGENVALNKNVTGTFTALPPKDAFVAAGDAAQVLSRVTDGKMSYFTAMATSGPVTGDDQYVVIDLGKSYTIKNILSYWRMLAYPQSLTVQVSSDNVTWTTIADSVDAGSGVFARSEVGDPMTVVTTPSNASGRYVKLFIKKGSQFYAKHGDWNFVQLMEVQVFSE